MNIHSLIQILFIITFITLTFANNNDNTSKNPSSFIDQIETLQDAVKSLCSHMEKVSLVDSSTFLKLMQDAHRDCPDNNGMEQMLSYLGSMSEKHHSFVEKQLNAYRELLRVLSEGLKSGGMAVFYLKEGEYPLVTKMLNDWHLSFTTYRTSFYPADVPIQIMVKNNKVFYYDSWVAAIRSFITSCLMFISLIIVPLVWMNWTVITATAPMAPSVQSQLRKIKIICIAIVICVIIVRIDLLFKPMRINWYPSATSTLKQMETDRTYLITKVQDQINTIEQLQKHIDLYEDKAAQIVVNELVLNLVNGFGQASKEVADAYKSGVRVMSTFRRTYERIEEKALKAGKLSETKDLLLELNKTADTYEALQRSLEIEMMRQQNVMPILKDQITSIRELVKQDRLVELGIIISHHEKSLDNIFTNIGGVMYTLDEIILSVDNNNAYGMKNTIKSLINECESDKTTAKLKIGGGIVTMISAGGTGMYLGIIALKTGYILGSFTAAVAAPPLIIGAGLGLSIYYGAKGWSELQGASNYQKELQALETERMAMKIAMEQLHKAIDDQQNAVKSSKTSMNNLAELSNHYSRKVSGFILKKEHKYAIKQDLDNLMKQYDNIEAVLALFAKNLNNHEDPSHRIN